MDLIVTRVGAWDMLSGLLGGDAALLEEGGLYQHIFYLDGVPSYLVSTIRAEVDAVVAALRASGVRDASGRLSGQDVILSYRVGLNPLLILGGIMAIAWVTALFVVGYAIYRAVSVIPGVPWWAGAGVAALVVMWLLPRARRVLT